MTLSTRTLLLISRYGILRPGDQYGDTGLLYKRGLLLGPPVIAKVDKLFFDDFLGDVEFFHVFAEHEAGLGVESGERLVDD